MSSNNCVLIHVCMPMTTDNSYHRAVGAQARTQAFLVAGLSRGKKPQNRREPVTLTMGNVITLA